MIIFPILISKKENAGKFRFGLHLGLSGPNLDHNFFLEVSALLDVRHVRQSCNPAQYQGKLMTQTSENGEKPIFGPNFENQIFFRKFYLY